MEFQDFVKKGIGFLLALFLLFPSCVPLQQPYKSKTNIWKFQTQEINLRRINSTKWRFWKKYSYTKKIPKSRLYPQFTINTINYVDLSTHFFLLIGNLG